MPTWDSQAQVEDYLRKLKDKADKLSLENRKLRKHHMTINDTLCELMSVDLLRSQHVWDAKLKDMKAMFAACEKKYDAENVVKWREFINRQLYKALEHQYQMGLESLNENLPEIKCDLHFHNK